MDMQQTIQASERSTYKVAEVSNILRISLRAAYNLCENKPPFPIIRIGSSVRVPKAQFDAWFDACCE